MSSVSNQHTCHSAITNPLVIFVAALLLLPYTAKPSNAIAHTRTGQSHTGTLTLQTNAFTITPPGQLPIPVALTNLGSLTLTGDTLAAITDQPGSGIGLLGYYYQGTNLLGTPLPRLDATVQFVWAAHHRPFPGFDKNYFSARWMGYLEPPRTDNYMIHFGTDDGGRFWVGDQGPYSLWQRQEYSETNTILRMEKGKRYKIRAEYFEVSGNARARLWWSSPRMPKTPIPQDRLHPASFLVNHPAQVDSDRGLLATYYDNPDFHGKSFTRIDPNINTHWSAPLTEPITALRKQWIPLHREEIRAARALEAFHSLNDRPLKRKDSVVSELETELQQIANEARHASERASRSLRDASTTLDNDIAPGIPANFFSVRWSGQVLAEQNDQYTFQVHADEETQLWFDNELTIDTINLPETLRFTRTLQAGANYPIRMETRNTDATGAVQLLWETPTMPASIVPTRNLTASHANDTPDNSSGSSLKFAPGVTLENGIYIQAPIQKADQTAIRFEGILANQSLPLLGAARIHIRAISPAQLKQLQPGRTGLLFVNGDFVEGQFVGLETGRVTISSVLFGIATFETATQVSVIVIRNGPGLPGPFLVKGKDGTIIHAPEIETTPAGIIFPGSSIEIPLHQLTNIRRTTPEE